MPLPPSDDYKTATGRSKVYRTFEERPAATPVSPQQASELIAKFGKPGQIVVGYRFSLESEKLFIELRRQPQDARDGDAWDTYEYLHVQCSVNRNQADVATYLITSLIPSSGEDHNLRVYQLLSSLLRGTTKLAVTFYMNTAGHDQFWGQPWRFQVENLA